MVVVQSIVDVPWINCPRPSEHLLRAVLILKQRVWGMVDWVLSGGCAQLGIKFLMVVTFFRIYSFTILITVV